jgi:hypothetical protein
LAAIVLGSSLDGNIGRKRQKVYLLGSQLQRGRHQDRVWSITGSLRLDGGLWVDSNVQKMLSHFSLRCSPDGSRQFSPPAALSPCRWAPRATDWALV